MNLWYALENGWEVYMLVTCAGRLLGQLLGLPNTRPCDHETAWAHNLRSKNLEDERHIYKRERIYGQKQKQQQQKHTFSELTSRHYRCHCPQCLHEGSIYHQVTTGIGEMLERVQVVIKVRWIDCKWSVMVQVNKIIVTRYRSEETLTRMRSSPTLTFSPSDLCLEAGWMVHQQASPETDKQIKNVETCIIMCGI